jgi:hypothetical protein
MMKRRRSSRRRKTNLGWNIINQSEREVEKHQMSDECALSYIKMMKHQGMHAIP